MAKVQIGAVIGVDGAKQYKAQLDACTAATKNLASQTKLIEASFEGATKSVYDLARQKTALKGEIIGVGEKLAAQRAELSQVVEAYKRGDENALKYKNQMYDLATATNNTETELYKLENRLKELNQENGLTLFVKGWEESTNKTGEALRSIGGFFTKYVTVPIVAGATASVKVATDFQSAFTGVKKTVDEIVDENGNVVYSYEQLEKELRKIPLETASSYETVMAVAEAAGQLGISADEVSDFTKTIIMLGDSTSVSAEEGAVSIAQFLNIMGEGPETASKFGSALVELGNNTATDEASILALATRLASAGKLVGLSTADILGLSAAMSSVGLTAEAGGTAMSTTMKMITNAVRDGGDRLQVFAELTGTTTEEFAEKWRTKPVEALQDVLIGFSNLEGGSEEMLSLMDELGWAGIRQSDTVQRLTLNYDGVADSVKMANDAYENNTALSEEANKRYEDFASELSQFKESVKQLADAFGRELIPILQPLVDKATDMITAFSEMDEQTKENILKFLGLVAIIGPVVGGIGNLMIWVAKLKGAFGALKGAEGIGGVITKIGGTGGSGGLIKSMGSLITKGEELAGSILNTVAPALEGTGALSLGGALVGAAVAYGGAHAAATKMDQKMYESAEACEYVAKRYHWSEEKVNEFGYTWDENGHLVALSTQNMVSAVESSNADLLQDVDRMKEGWRQKAKEAMNNVKKEIDDGTPNVQESTHKMVLTGVDEMRTASNQASTYGQHLGENFANGISSRQGWVSNAVSGLANIVRSFLHFSEPDTGPLSTFNSWMPDMMSQMASGITDNIYMVENALNDLTGGMANQLGGQSYNYGGVVINLNVPQGANGYQLVDEIEQALADRTVRRRAVFNG